MRGGFREAFNNPDPPFWKFALRAGNLFEKFVMNQANRLVKIENPTRDDLMIIKEADVFDR